MQPQPPTKKNAFLSFLTNPYTLLGFILVIYGCIYSLVSIVNHNLFKTYALDLGIYTHGIYRYAHFKFHNYTLGLEGIEINHLGNHFSPLVALFSPLVYLFKSYTLLIVQIASILFGAVGVYVLAYDKLKKTTLAALISILFLSFYGIISALSFDFHMNVIAAMLVPWFYFFFIKKSNYTYLFFAFILMAKENMALWMFFILLGMLIRELQLKKYDALKRLSILMAIALSYFLLVQMVLMPAFNPYGVSNHISNYEAIGDSLPDILARIINEPRYVFSYLFESYSTNLKVHGIKSESIFMLLVSGGIVFFFRPAYAVMILPILAQKMFSNHSIHWSINAHYSIEFIPVICLATIDWLSSMKQYKKTLIILTALVLSSILFHKASIEHRKASYYDRRPLIFYKKEHYRVNYDIQKIQEAIQQVPDKVIISCSSSLAPRLAFRDYIYHFPVIKDAEYIVICKNRDFYPYNKKKQQDNIASLMESGSFHTYYENAEVLILEKSR